MKHYALGNRPSPSLASSGRSDPDYENRSPELRDFQQPSSLRVSFASLNALDNEQSSASPQHQEVSNSKISRPSSGNSTKGLNEQQPQLQQQPTLNNGYIGGATT